jgi:hypothetical protein
MLESLILFDSICSSKWFSDATIVLCFTKMDIFECKISSGMHPIDGFLDCPGFEGTSNDVVAAKEYITDRFKAIMCEQHRETKIFYINATESDDVQGLWTYVLEITKNEAEKRGQALLKSRSTPSAWPLTQLPQASSSLTSFKMTHFDTRPLDTE